VAVDENEGVAGHVVFATTPHETGHTPFVSIIGILTDGTLSWTRIWWL
jgi:hypothetical protein